VTRFATPSGQIPRARSTMTKQEVLGLAQRYRTSIVPIEKTDPSIGTSTAEPRRTGQSDPREFVGYVRVFDLAVTDSPDLSPVLPLLKINNTAPCLAAVMAMQCAREEIALVVDSQGHALGIVTADQLREPLFHAGQ